MRMDFSLRWEVDPRGWRNEGKQQGSISEVLDLSEFKIGVRKHLSK